jgi:hypothetical protein
MEPIQAPSIDAAARIAGVNQGTKPLDNIEISQYYIDIKHGMNIPYASVVSATETDTSLPPELQAAKATLYCTEVNNLSKSATEGEIKAEQLISKPSIFLCVQGKNQRYNPN